MIRDVQLNQQETGISVVCSHAAVVCITLVLKLNNEHVLFDQFRPDLTRYFAKLRSL